MSMRSIAHWHQPCQPTRTAELSRQQYVHLPCSSRSTGKKEASKNSSVRKCATGRTAIMIRCLSLLAVLVVVAAQRPEVCNSPDSWSANMVIFDPMEGHEFAMEAKYYYDKTGLRKARIESIDPGRNSSHRFVHVIELFEEHVRYDIDLGTHECVRTPLNRPGALQGFHPHDVPADASFRGLFYIGSDAVSDGHVEATAWDYYYADRGYFWHGTFTTHGCIPLRSDHFNHTTFGARFEEFFDVVPGITDPDVFVPPSNCRPGKV